MTDPGDSPGFLYTLLDEAVGPYQVPGLPYIIDVPTPDVLAMLDYADDTVDVLVAFLGMDEADRLLGDLFDLPYSKTVAVADGILDHFGLETPPPYGYRWLATELDRYGEGIEYDLQQLGVNLYDFVLDSGRWPWSKFARLLRQLPIGGGYNTARITNVALAQELADEEDRLAAAGETPPSDNRPPARGWTPELEELTQIKDALMRVEHGMYATSPKHKKITAPPPKPSKRPKLAKERAANLRLLREHDDIAGKVLGKRYTPKGW